MDKQLWEAFEKINKSRRAVKHFTNEAIPDDDMRAILSAAQLAPSSLNLQPYQFHWIKDKELCKKMATACNGQRAAASAATFVVVVANWNNLSHHYNQFLEHVDQSGLYDEKSKVYHKSKKKQIVWFTRIMRLWIFGWLKSIFSCFTRHIALAPLGKSGLDHWATKGSIFAAQTLLLAASARGVDSCPMEGFNAFKVAKLLGIRQGVIPLVIALGKRDNEKSLTPSWRLPYEATVIEYGTESIK